MSYNEGERAARDVDYPSADIEHDIHQSTSDHQRTPEAEQDCCRERQVLPCVQRRGDEEDVEQASYLTGRFQRCSTDSRIETEDAESANTEPADTEPLLGEARFASIHFLRPWFPQSDPTLRRTLKGREWLSSRQSLLSTACGVAWTVLVVNLVAATYLPLKYTDARLFTGNCTTANRLDSALHILINLLSTLLLGASNLCVQLLSAPTRQEVDKAHEQKIWLDIGTPSVFRNLKHVALRRKIAVVILALASLPLHFLWNSSTLTTQPENEYYWSVVTPDFLDGASWNFNASESTVLSRAGAWVNGLRSGGSLEEHYLQVPNGPLNETAYVSYLKGLQDRISSATDEEIKDAMQFRRLDRLECLTAYLTYARDASNLLMISSTDAVDESNNPLQNNNSLLVSGWYGSKWTANTWPVPLWQCGYSNTFSCVRPDTWINNASSVSEWNVYGYKIDYCLSKAITLEDKCSVRFELALLIAVCIANLFKCLCISYTLWLYSDTSNTPLSTMGDAAASFLKDPDPCTEHMSLASRMNIDELWKQKEPQQWLPARYRWYTVTSKSSWLIGIILCFIVVAIAIAFLATGIFQVEGQLGTSHFSLAALGFGRLNVYEPVSFLGHDLIRGIMFANCWQVVLSLLYVQYNALVTAFLVGDEWCRFACVDFDNRTSTREYQQSDFSYASSKDSATFQSLHVSEPTDNSEVSDVWKRQPCETSLRASWTRWINVTAKYTSTSLRQILAKIRKWSATQRRVHPRKTLRVTVPEGIQRSSYFVSMPWKYGIPLMMASSILHWLISQSVFVYASDLYKADGTLDTESPLTTGTAFSLTPIICSLSMGLILIATLIILGLKRYPLGMPLASSCSAAISAACHRPSGDHDAHLFPVYWGGVEYREGVGRCSLTTARDVVPPVAGALYA